MFMHLPDKITGIVTANILSTTNHIGIGTTTGSYCGSFSWGRLSGFKRGSTAIGIGVSGFTVNSGRQHIQQSKEETLDLEIMDL